MRLILPPLLLLTACSYGMHTAPRATLPAPPSLDSLREGINSRIAIVPGAEVSVYYHELSRRDSLEIRPDVAFHAASTMKLPVMIELFRRLDAKQLTLNQTLPIQNSFPSLVDGTPFTLDRASDSDVSLYARIGQTATLRQLNQLMIARSSNLAANLLLQFLDPKTVNATAHQLGAHNMTVLRGVEDGKAFDKGLNNTVTARDLGVLLTGIERGTVASARSCAQMKTVLLSQFFNTEIPAGLPAGVQVAHKTGWITGTLHDAALVYPKNRAPYVLVVMTRGIANERAAQALIANISGQVYAFSTSR